MEEVEGCAECGTPITASDGTSCGGCDVPLCGECTPICDGCGELVCGSCITRTPDGRPFHAECVATQQEVK